RTGPGVPAPFSAAPPAGRAARAGWRRLIPPARSPDRHGRTLPVAGVRLATHSLPGQRLRLSPLASRVCCCAWVVLLCVHEADTALFAERGSCIAATRCETAHRNQVGLAKRKIKIF